ncbi:hypothetical protein M378DRAFT_456261 [Amanita muscaria Koide BX008]|uniref:Uncharacterized protein n=1 Tax=Amanita muscaria (strain Koide BX008) TaxID=946122 RepID=A0A0C2TFN2_AMAMK|nr:hypothetical protein M378DRAFT_456261 [Amanita muscaria Koide BX008]
MSPVRLTIGPIYPNNISLPVVTQICQILADFNSRVQFLEITTETSLLAGMILSGIFSTPIVFPTLESLSIRVEDDPGKYTSEWPHLNVVLERAIGWFPMLRTLAINTFNDCIPVYPERSSFAHLHTLILDGTLEQGEGYIGSMVAVLYSTSRLETLWLKHFAREQNLNVDNLHVKGREIHIPVPLPCLTSLSIAVPGCGADITECIDAPALHELHIDGSRGPMYGETECDDILWSDWEARSVLDSLKHLANGSQHLRRLAITSTYLTAGGWQWLLFGEGKGPPFPQLECLALHGLDESSGEISCGFSDALLLHYSQEPSICLSKLTLLRCRFPLSGMALVRAIKAKPFELEFDRCCPQLSTDEYNTLVDLQVKLCRRQEWEVKEDEWWTRGHQIDASDSHVY